MHATVLTALLLVAPHGASAVAALPLGMVGAAEDAPGAKTDTDEVPADTEPPVDDVIYQPVRLEVSGLVWYGPGQRGLIEAHPLVMGLGVMALATVTLLFFFLRGVKRPKDDDK